MKTCCGVLVLLCSCAFWCGAVQAQTVCGENRPLTAQERIVLRDIEERIQESIEADEAKDLAAKMAGMTLDTTTKLLDGTLLNRKEIEEGQKRDYEWILSVSDKTRVSVKCLRLQGKEALVFTDQRFARMVPDRKNGSPHELITNMTHRETWVWTEKGWRSRHVEELESGPMLLDGEPFTP